MMALLDDGCQTQPPRRADERIQGRPACGTRLGAELGLPPKLAHDSVSSCHELIGSQDELLRIKKVACATRGAFDYCRQRLE